MDTNLEHLEAAESRLKYDGRHTMAHVVQDAREEIVRHREIARVRMITGKKEARSIPLTVTALTFAFVDECRGMSHADTASTALTLIRELQQIADESTEAAASQN